jgi:hypothetical protein
MIDDQTAPSLHKLLQGCLNAPRPLDSICQMTPIEVIEHYVVARKIGRPGIPCILGSSSRRGSRYLY